MSFTTIMDLAGLSCRPSQPAETLFLDSWLGAIREGRLQSYTLHQFMGQLSSPFQIACGFQAIGSLDHPNDVFVNCQNISLARDVLDQKFAHHLVAQRVAQAFDARGTCRLIAVGGAAARNYAFDFGTG